MARRRHYVRKHGKQMPSGRAAAKKGWKTRRRVARSLTAYHRRVLQRRGYDLAADRGARTAADTRSAADVDAIEEWKKDPSRFDIAGVDNETFLRIAAARKQRRHVVAESKSRVRRLTRGVRSVSMRLRRRRDLTAEQKREEERRLRERAGQDLRRERAIVARALAEERAAGKVAIRITVRRKWSRERLRRARLVAEALGTENVLIADLLIGRAERADRPWDTVSWEAVQAGVKRPDYTEYVAQLEGQLGRETVSPGEAARMTEIAPGKFIDIDAELGRAAEEYGDFLFDQARRQGVEMSRDEWQREVREFKERAASEASEEVGGWTLMTPEDY